MTKIWLEKLFVAIKAFDHAKDENLEWGNVIDNNSPDNFTRKEVGTAEDAASVDTSSTADDTVFSKEILMDTLMIQH